MGASLTLPAALRDRAERDTWFDSDSTMSVLDWLDASNMPLLSIETARKLNDGKWMLLLDPMLSTSSSSGFAVQQGRDFVSQHAALDMMFEPYW